MTFEEFFYRKDGNKPYPYQAKMASEDWTDTLVIPTGVGKTDAVISNWIWRIANGMEYPRRLAYVLPMRTLVEQVEVEAKKWIVAAKECFPGFECEFDILMGGRNSKNRWELPNWMLYPEAPAILIGTQDMLVSSALMRGYGMSRYRWPMAFALLNNDTFWVFDEVQLAGASLSTSVQLEAFREFYGTFKNCRTLWMSATFDPEWLKTVDFEPKSSFRPHDLSAEDLNMISELWNADKSLYQLKPVEKEDRFEAVIRKALEITEPGQDTIVFCNRVKTAQHVFQGISKKSKKENNPVQVSIVHSRFRRSDRNAKTAEILSKIPEQGRIIVSTQALEAGVDISCKNMITELAPWTSLVQRFGRCNRRGEHENSTIYWVDITDEKSILPYDAEDFRYARQCLYGIDECGLKTVSSVKPNPPKKMLLLRKKGMLDLFNTEPDLDGSDMDVSPYVRDAEDTDVYLFWRPIPENEKQPSADAFSADRNEICPVSINDARKLFENKNADAWLWNPNSKKWLKARKQDLIPGRIFWMSSKSGGYSEDIGFDLNSKDYVKEIDISGYPTEGFEDDITSNSGKEVTLADHSLHGSYEMQELCRNLSLNEQITERMVMSIVWHDVGKLHDVFTAKWGYNPLEDKVFLAKWGKGRTSGKPRKDRKYFRHELASMLAFMENNDWSPDFNLEAYLILSHHGKIRTKIKAMPGEIENMSWRIERDELYARGVVDGDKLPCAEIYPGLLIEPTEMKLNIMSIGKNEDCGDSWDTRVSGLLAEYGPFRLAWLETLLRIADIRASIKEAENE